MSPTRTAPLVIYMFIEAPKYKQEGRICSGCISMRPFVKQASTNPPPDETWMGTNTASGSDFMALINR